MTSSRLTKTAHSSSKRCAPAPITPCFAAATIALAGVFWCAPASAEPPPAPAQTAPAAPAQTAPAAPAQTAPAAPAQAAPAAPTQSAPVAYGLPAPGVATQAAPVGYWPAQPGVGPGYTYGQPPVSPYEEDDDEKRRYPEDMMVRRSPGMMAGGITLTAIGGAGLLGGVICLFMGAISAFAPGGGRSSGFLTAAGIMAGGGAVSLGVGIPLLKIGGRKVPKTIETQAWLAPTKLTLTF